MKNRLANALVMSIATGLAQLEFDGTLTKEQSDAVSAMFDKHLYTLLDGNPVEVQAGDGKVATARLTATDPLFATVEQQITFLANREAIETKGYTE